MNAAKYQGVILAAGHGSRMGPFGEEYPKPIAPICNKPLMAYQLEHLRAMGIEEVLVVIGHLGERIQAALGDGAAWGLRIAYVEQKARLGLAHAVGQLEPHIDRPFVLMLGDIFFEVSDLTQMTAAFEANAAAAVLAVKEESNPEAIKRNFSVLLRDDGAVRRVIEKPRQAANRLKGCGIYLFDERIFEAVRRTPRTAMRDEYELTDSIQILIDYEYPVRIASVVEWDINLTFVGDLVHCCQRQLATLGKRSLVGADCKIDGGVRLVDTVVGDGARISQPMELTRCVVLPGCTVPSASAYADTVFTRNAVLKASQTV